MNRAIRSQVEQAIAESDVLLFVVDIESGIHPIDLEIAQYLRKARRPLILVVNKADNLPDETRQLAFYELGLGDPFAVSAAVGKSSGDLLDRLVSLLPDTPEANARRVRPCRRGRPLERREVESNEQAEARPGDTCRRRARDDTRHHRRHSSTRVTEIIVHRHPGLRKRNRSEDRVHSTSDQPRDGARRCLSAVVDAKAGCVQDLKIANDMGAQGSQNIAVNKWDLIEEKVTNTTRDGNGTKRRARHYRVHSVLLRLGEDWPARPQSADAIVAVAAGAKSACPRRSQSCWKNCSHASNRRSR
jgi:GTP-binding protein